MAARPLITAARYAATVTGLLLIALVLVNCRQGTSDVIGVLRASLLNVETTLREWFDCLRLR